MSSYGYDPARIVLLRTRTIEAIEALRHIRCDDPLGADAVRAVRLLRQNLEDAWLPLLDAIHSSRAMVTWRRAAGLVTGLDECSLSALVDQLGATSTWVAATGLDDLDDGHLVARLGDAVERLERAVVGGGAVGESWTDLERVLAETARRLVDDDGTLASLLWTRMGTDGVETMVAALDAAGQITDLDLLAGPELAGPGATGAEPREAFERLGAPLAAVLGAIAASGPGGRDAVTGQVTASTHLAGVVAAHADAFDGPTLIAVASDLVGYVSGTGRWAHLPRVFDRTRPTDAVLHALAASPVLSLQLLADPVVASALPTAAHLDDDAVEAVVAAALAAPLLDPESLGDALEVLAGLVARSASAELNVGTRRGVALSSGVLWPTVAPVLDGRTMVDVAVPTSDDHAREHQAHVVRLGSYAEVVRLLGQVVDDEPAQLTLGVVVGAFRADQLDVAAAAIRERSQLDPASATSQVAAALADVSRVLDLVDTAVDTRNDLLAFRHGLANSEATAVIDLVGTLVSWVAPGGGSAGRLASLTTRGISTAVGSSSPGTVPDTGLPADLAIDFLATVVALPLQHTDLRHRLGLGQVAPSTWDQLDDLLDELDDTADADERSHLRSRIRQIVDHDPDLDRYVEEVAALSGEAALGRG